MKIFNISQLISNSATQTSPEEANLSNRTHSRISFQRETSLGDLSEFKRAGYIERLQAALRTSTGIDYDLFNSNAPHYLPVNYVDHGIPHKVVNINDVSDGVLTIPQGGSRIFIGNVIMTDVKTYGPDDRMVAAYDAITYQALNAQSSDSLGLIVSTSDIQNSSHLMIHNTELLRTPISYRSMMPVAMIYKHGIGFATPTRATIAISRRVVGAYVDIPHALEPYDDVMRAQPGKWSEVATELHEYQPFVAPINYPSKQRVESLITRLGAIELNDGPLIPDLKYVYINDPFEITTDRVTITPLRRKASLAIDIPQSPVVSENFKRFLNMVSTYDRTYQSGGSLTGERVELETPAIILKEYFQTQRSFADSDSSNDKFRVYFQNDSSVDFANTSNLAVLMKHDPASGTNTSLEFRLSDLPIVDNSPGPWMIPPSSTRRRLTTALIKLQRITLPIPSVFVYNEDTGKGSWHKVKYPSETFNTYNPNETY